MFAEHFGVIYASFTLNFKQPNVTKLRGCWLLFKNAHSPIFYHL